MSKNWFTVIQPNFKSNQIKNYQAASQVESMD